MLTILAFYTHWCLNIYIYIKKTNEIVWNKYIYNVPVLNTFSLKWLICCLTSLLLLYHYLSTGVIRVSVMDFNATFNNISVISWRSVWLVEETRVLGENQWPVVSHLKTLSHNAVSSIPSPEWDSNSQR